MSRWGAYLFVLFLSACGATEPETNQTNDDAPSTKAEAAEAVDSGKGDFSFDICERRGWYGDGSCDWFCVQPDTDCDQPELFANPSGGAAEYPIVLAHGFNASPEFLSFTGIEEALVADGHVVGITTVPPHQSVEVRAGYLADEVDRVLAETGAERVNIVAHSMGGLDSRFLISRLGYSDRVASLTTISTPHRGSGVADAFLGVVEDVADEALNGLAVFLGVHFSELSGNADLRAALHDLAEETSTTFNRDVENEPGVHYQSWAGVSNVLGILNPLDDVACGVFLRNPGTVDKMSPLLVKIAAFVAHGSEFRPNDGLVTVESAKWGEFKGCIPADHADIVGAMRPEGPDAATGFNHVSFYRHVAFDLAENGF